MFKFYPSQQFQLNRQISWYIETFPNDFVATLSICKFSY